VRVQEQGKEESQPRFDFLAYVLVRALAYQRGGPRGVRERVPLPSARCNLAVAPWRGMIEGGSELVDAE
jgi:hypothetical protein